ncbi:MAG: electron transfer flavoprotein subunit alpha/FixB family protein, partial [Nitrososphaerota archaeon]|nr:electron transfer flavoprotein subunit alpha/FixB family protein [Nitrososphaerota archaeon]
MEIENGKPIPVSLEMLGEARRLMDEFNKKYSSKEKVVAILLGDNVKEVTKTLIQYGADAVIIAESPELKDVRNTIYTKVISQIAQDSKLADQIEEEYAGQVKKPRYMFFGADSIGRHLSSTVLVELDSGLASDINQLVISDLKITHQHKTAGNPITFEKTLEMYRPDFSGFLWTTILCLDNKNPKFPRDYSPQACSLIPGVFEPIEPDSSRQGKIIEFVPQFDEKDLRIKILSREIIKKEIDFDSYKAIVSFGRGIKDDPEKNIKLIENLAEQL